MFTCTRKALVASALCAGLGLIGLQAQAQIVNSTFDRSSEGWVVADLDEPGNNLVGTFAITWNASGGNPGGYISSTDPSPNNFTFSAPNAFLGNKALTYGGSLQYDVFDTQSDGTPQLAVFLKGAGQTLVYTTAAPAAAFTTYTVPLTPGGWNLNGTTPTPAQMQAILGNLDALYIRGDWAAGPDFSGLDNVKLFAGTNVVPEPGAIATLTGASVFVTCLFVRRRRK